MKTKLIKLALVVSALGFALPSYAAPLCSVGDKAEVLWQGKWYPASVLKVNDKKTSCFIHYDGYKSDDDEWVGADRIRVALKVGDIVSINWKGDWYPGSVIGVKDGKYRVHYDGYPSSDDEWVSRDKIKRK